MESAESANSAVRSQVQQTDAIKLSISDLCKVIPFVKMPDCTHARKVQIVVGHLLFCLKGVACDALYIYILLVTHFDGKGDGMD